MTPKDTQGHPQAKEVKVLQPTQEWGTPDGHASQEMGSPKKTYKPRKQGRQASETLVYVSVNVKTHQRRLKKNTCNLVHIV